MPPDKIIPFPEPEDELHQQAVKWVVRLNSGEATKGDREAFTEWVQQDEQHLQAFFEARQVWMQMGHLDVTEKRVLDGNIKHFAVGMYSKRKRRAAFAGLTICLLAACFMFAKPFYFRYIAADFKTLVGEIKPILFIDGSMITLNTDTLIAKHFTDTERHIELLAGEAEFDVADDPRPFTVTAGSGTTRALGTRFIVRYTDDDASVSVLEHAVEIQSANHKTVTLNAGYRLDYNSNGLTDVPEAIDISAANGWRDGKLKFNAQPLREVVAEIDRYVPGKIILANNRMADHKVSGVFEINNLGRSISVIAQSLHLQTAQVGQLLCVIY